MYDAASNFSELQDDCMNLTMGLFVLLLWTCLITTILVIVMKFILEFLVLRLFHSTCQVDPGNKAYSYRRLSRDAPAFAFVIENTALKFNPLGLFFSRWRFFSGQFGSITLELRGLTKSPSHPSATVSRNVFIQVCIHVLMLLIKRVHISVNSLTIRKGTMLIVFHRINLMYSFDKVVGLRLELGPTTVRLSTIPEIMFDPITFEPTADIDPVLSVIHLEALAIPFKAKTTPVLLTVRNHKIELKPIDFSFLLPRGQFQFTSPTLLGRMSITLPTMALSITDCSMFWSLPQVDFPILVLDIFDFTFSSATLTIENRDLLKVADFESDRRGSEPWKFTVRSVDISWHILTAVLFIPFISKWVQQQNMEERLPIRLSFPHFLLRMEFFNLRAKLADGAELDLSAPNLSYKDRRLEIPAVAIRANRADVLVLKEISLYIADGEILGVDLKKLRFRDRHVLSLEHFLVKCLGGWRLIAPLILRPRIDRESLPFPLRITADAVLIQFDESKLNSSLSRASRVMPGNLSDAFVRTFLLAKKLHERAMAPSVGAELIRKLRQVQFQEYRKQLTAISPHKYNFVLSFTKVVVSLDSTGLVMKLANLHELDIATKDCCPNTEWLSIIGLNVNARCSEFSITAFDIDTPIMHCTNLRFSGPVLVAEPKAPAAISLHFQIEGKSYSSLKNPMKLRLYSDLLIEGDAFYYYFGRCYQAVYQELMIVIAQVIPYGADPSPRLAWFDLLRMQFRGRYCFNFDSWEVRLAGTESYRNSGNYLAVQIGRFHLFTREGNISFSCSCCTTTRFFEHRPGPNLCEFASTIISMRFHWVTRTGATSGDARRHILTPDVSQFSATGYDTYANFRCTEVVVDDCTVSFDDTEAVTPCVTVDFAHLEWLVHPLVLIGEAATRKGQLAKKLGFKHIPRLPIKYMDEVHRRGHVRIVGHEFIVRIFDSFPIKEARQVQRASLELRLTDVQAAFEFSLALARKEHSGTFRSGGITLRAPDVARYATGKQTAPSQLLLIRSLTATLGERAVLNLEEIVVAFNQLAVRYLHDFAAAVERPRAAAGLTAAFQDTKPADFVCVKTSGVVKSLRVVCSSLESDLRFTTHFKNIRFAQLLRAEASPLAGVQVSVEEVRVSADEERALALIRQASVFSACRCTTAAIEIIEVDVRPEEVAGARLLAWELGDFERPPRAAVRPARREPLKAALAVQAVKWAASAGAVALEGSIEEISAGMLAQSDDTVDLSLTVAQIAARNVSRDAVFREIFGRWSPAGGRPVRPHLIARLKMPPKLSAHYVFSQAEVNIEPSLLSMESGLFETVTNRFKQEYVPKRGRPVVLASERPVRPLPPVLFSAACFPPESGKAVVSNDGPTSQFSIAKEEIEGTMMWRYFRLNGVSINFSYKNLDNKILPEIHNFQGQIHEIIYHDLSASAVTLFNKLVYDVAVIMIPQFLKHCVGLKRSDITPEQAIAEWLNKDDQRMSVQEKQKMLLFGPSAKKK
jgi:hypothetical protein